MAEVEWNGDELLRDLMDGMDRGVRASAIELEGEIKKTLTVPPARAGREYAIPKADGTPGSRRHRASAPGEPPAVLYNNLRASITHNVSRNSGGIRGAVGPGADGPQAGYAEKLEDEMDRPYMRPTWDEHKQRLARIVLDETAAHLRDKGWTK